MAKRLFDLVGASLALLLLSPLLLLVALAIRLDSPGPVFFRQERVGRGGVPFRIHKFRTMRADAPALGPQVTVGQDVRITRVGHWLRSRRIDELPQFIDVLLGRMSLVGPRPEVPRYVALYPPGLRERALAVRPGITDPASAAGRDQSHDRVGLVRRHLIEDGLGALEIDEGMHALGALAQFTHGLGTAEKEDAENGLLSLREIGILVLEGVFALRHARPGLVDEDGELLVA